jgi:polyhydroxyalkanoate synthesis regulator phasin
MAETQKKNDLFSRLADLTEEAKQRLSDAPGGDRVLTALNAMRDRVEELQRRVRGLEELEHRLDALERKVDKLAKSSTPLEASSASASKAPGGNKKS